MEAWRPNHWTTKEVPNHRILMPDKALGVWGLRGLILTMTKTTKGEELSSTRRPDSQLCILSSAPSCLSMAKKVSFSGSTEILTSQFFGLHCFEWASHVALAVKKKNKKKKPSCNVGDTSESESHSVVSDSLRPHGLYSPWKSPGQNTGMSSLSLLQGIFPTQGLNPGLPHRRQILYQLSHKGSPRDANSVPGLGRSPGEGYGNPLQYFCLENSMDRRAWWTTVHRVAKSRTRLK